MIRSKINGSFKQVIMISRIEFWGRGKSLISNRSDSEFYFKGTWKSDVWQLSSLDWERDGMVFSYRTDAGIEEFRFLCG